MKKNLAKLIAIGLVLTISASFGACSKTEDPDASTTSPAGTSSNEATQEESTTLVSGSITAPPATKNGTTVSPASTGNTVNSGSVAQPGGTTIPLGSDKAKIAAFYNAAVDKTNAQSKIKGSDTMKISNIYRNGSKDSTMQSVLITALKLAPDGKYNRLPPSVMSKSGVRPSDLSGASCTQSGNRIKITLTAITEATTTPPSHGRIFDLKNDLLDNIFNNVTFYGDKSKDFRLTYTNSTLTAEMDAQTGKILRIDIKMNIKLSIKNANVVIFKVDSDKGATGDLTVIGSYTVS